MSLLSLSTVKCTLTPFLVPLNYPFTEVRERAFQEEERFIRVDYCLEAREDD